MLAALVIVGCTGSSNDSAESSPDVAPNPDPAAPSEEIIEAGAVSVRKIVDWEFIPVDDLDLPAGPSFAPTQFGFVEGRFVAVGGNYEPAQDGGEWLPHSWHSTDGRRWESGGMAQVAESTDVRLTIRALLPTPDQMYAIGSRTTLTGSGGLPVSSPGLAAYVSSDGISWQLADPNDVDSIVGSIGQEQFGTFPCRFTTRSAVEETDNERWIDICSTRIACEDWPDCGEIVAGRGFATEGEVVTIAENQAVTSIGIYGDALMASTQAIDGGESDGHWRSEDHGATWFPVETTSNVVYSHPAAVGSNPDLPYVLPPTTDTVTVANLAATLTLDLSGGFEVRVPSAWVTPDGGRTWQIENFPAYAPFPTMTKLAGGGRYFIAGARLIQQPYESAGIYLGTIDVEHELVDAGRLVEPNGSTSSSGIDSDDDIGVPESSANGATSGAPLSIEAVLAMTIPAGACQQMTLVPVQLSAGAAEVDGVSLWISNDLPGQVVVDDVNDDGIDDAVAIVNCSGGGNAVLQSIMVWIAGSEPEDIWPQLSGGAADLVGGGYVAFVEAIQIDADSLVVDWVGSLPGDARCCPSLPASSRYEWTDVGVGEFVRHDAVDR